MPTYAELASAALTDKEPYGATASEAVKSPEEVSADLGSPADYGTSASAALAERVPTYAEWDSAQLGAGEETLPIVGGRVTSFGDSFIANAASKSGNAITTYNSGVMVNAEAVSLGAIQFDYDRNKGVNGEKTADINARIETDAAGLADSTDVWFYSGGRNDEIGGVTPAATTIANIKAGCATLIALGKPVILDVPCPPRGSRDAAAKTFADTVNTAIAAWAATQPNVIYDDYNELIVDTDGYSPKADYTYDETHPSRIWAFVQALSLWTNHGSKFPARNNTPDYLNYNSSTKPFGNLLGLTNATAYTLTGTSGQKFNATGSLASNYKTGRYSGASADGDIVLSKETVGDGTFRQVFTMAMTGDYSAGELIANNSFGAPPATPAELVGKLIAAEMTLIVTANDGISFPAMQVNARNNSATVSSIGMSSLDGLTGNEFSIPPGTYLLRSPPVLVAATDATPTNWLALIGRMISGTSATHKIVKPWYGRVS